MPLSNGFLGQVRQYAALESRMNRDFSEPILVISSFEVDRMIAFGVTREEAEAEVNVALANEVKRYPVQIP